MLIQKVKFKKHRSSDQLSFTHKYHCDQVETMLSKSCLHLPKQGVIIYLNEHDEQKLKALQPIINNCSLDKIKNIADLVTIPSDQTIISLLTRSFNNRFGWFFKNGNK